MVNIFSNPNTIDFIFVNNTIYDLHFNVFNNSILKSKSTIANIAEINLGICELKTLYNNSPTIKSWFDLGWITYIPEIGGSPPDCGGGGGGSGTSIPVSPTAPASPVNGDIWIRSTDNVLFIYDSTRSKWLSEGLLKISASRNFNSVTDQYLMSDEGIYTNQDPFVYTDNLTIVKIIAKSTTVGNWVLKLKDNDLDTDLATFNINGGQLLSNSVDVNLDANINMSFYLEGSGVGFPNVDLIARYRG